MNRYLLSIDQGTTGSTALVMGMDGRTLGRESQERTQHFPEPAWVEHDPAKIQASVIEAVGALRAPGLGGDHPWRCELRAPRAVLPRIVPSTGGVACTRGFEPLSDGVPIAGVVGAQRAVLFGQACFAAGDAKCSRGTVAFPVVDTGLERVRSAHGLFPAVAWQIGEPVVYALQGSCCGAGAAVQWRDGLGWIRSSSQIEALEPSVASSDDVVCVRALSGPGAPDWDPDARGLLPGLTRGSSGGPTARATLRSHTFQVADLASYKREDLSLQRRAADVLPKPVASAGRSGDRGSTESAEGGVGIRRIRVDGGAAQNNLLMQFQSDVSDVGIERPFAVESTARGAAMLAGVGVSVFRSVKEAAQLVEHPERFQPQMARSERQERLSHWQAAVLRARSELDVSVVARAEEGRHGH